MELTGAQILLECLKREGVEVVFGFPGGAVIDIYNELPNASFRHVLVRHEQGAIHAADGYARASGRVGVCLVTSGPGATNTVTGIATAYMDSIPVVILTGQVPTPLIGNDAFQEVDIVGITRPCTKHNYLVKNVKDLAHVIRQAFYLARSGRPGPVLVDLPKDVMQARTEFAWPEDVRMRSYNPTYKPHAGQIRKVAQLIRDAERPLIYAGGGVISSKAHEALTWLAKNLHIPVTATLMGLGCFPGDDKRRWLGMLGMHGPYAANMAVNNADLVLAVGARFDDRVTGKVSTFAPKATLVHIDIDPTSIQKKRQRPRTAGLRLSPRPGGAEGGTGAQPRGIRLRGRAHALDHQGRRVGQGASVTYKPGNGAIKPQSVVEKLHELTGGDAIICTEVGQNQMWAAQFYTFNKPTPSCPLADWAPWAMVSRPPSRATGLP
jgi:acetolactate synthase-1/2/3 large subunit